MREFNEKMSTGMWKVVFYERKGSHIQIDRSAPWLPNKQHAKTWGQWFLDQGYHVALQDQIGNVERLSVGLPG